MNIYNSLGSSIADMCTTFILARKTSAVFALFVSISGLFSGIFFSIYLSPEDKTYLSEIIAKSVSENANVLPAVLINIVLLLSLFLAGFSVYGFPVILTILAGKAFAIGSCGELLCHSSSIPASNLLLLSFIPANLILLTALTTASVTSLNFALDKLNKRSRIQPKTRHFISIYLLLTFLVVISAIVQTVSLSLCN